MGDPAPSKRLQDADVLEDALVCELLEARLIGVFATRDPRTAIHAVPMWHALYDGRVLLATGSRSRKVRNLEHDPRATFVLHDSRPGFEICGTSISGEVEIVRGTEAVGLVDLVHARYVVEGADDDPAVRAFLMSDDVALRLRPVEALTCDALRARGAALPLVSTDPRR
jgi:hypothetical protein